MRGGRSLLVLLVVALGLGAYIYFVEAERDPAGTETRDTVFSVAAADITGLTVRSGPDTTTLQRTDDEWSLVAPVAAPADSATVDSILSSLASMEIERVVDEAPSALAQFGLDTPAVQVTFTTADGASHQLSLGSEAPTGSGLYARVEPDPRLLLIPSFHKSTFERSPFDLRNRRVMEVSQDAVDRITLVPDSGTTIELQRDGADWRLTEPVAARADFSPADGLVSRVAGAQMTAIVAEGAEPDADALRSYGLDRPPLRVTLGAGSNAATLVLGAAHDDTSVYARDLSRNIIFTVDSSLLTDLRKEPADLRVKDIFEFNAFSAMSLEVTHDGDAVTYTKSVPASGADPDAQPTWSRTSPDAGTVNDTALTDLLNALSSLQAERFVDQAPASGETLDVVVRFGTSQAQTEERVTLRRSGGTVYAIRNGEAGAAVVPATEFDVVLSNLETLTTPPAPAAPAASDEPAAP